jgi:hypothetical protein
MQAEIRASLDMQYEPALVAELLAAHADLKRNFYLGGLRLAEVEGGRFAEAAFRMLQQETTGSFTPLGAALDTDKTIRDLAQLPRESHADSIRLHIPRGLRVIYDIRNSRDAAHLGDGIDPNVQDATLVATMADWILAEFLRLHHSVTADEAQKIVNELVARAAPIIEDFNGFLKLLDPSLDAGDQCLVLLYQRGTRGAEYSELAEWVHPRSRANLKRTLKKLVEDRAYVHEQTSSYFITATGQREVERRQLVEFNSA